MLLHLCEPQGIHSPDSHTHTIYSLVTISVFNQFLSFNICFHYLRQGGYVFTPVRPCLSVCLLVGRIAQKTTDQIYKKSVEEWGMGQESTYSSY